RGQPPTISAIHDGKTVDDIARRSGDLFHLVHVPLKDSDGTTIGTRYMATNLDAEYAKELARLAGTRTAILSDGLLVGSTLSLNAAREFEAAAAAAKPSAGTVSLDGESYAFLRLEAVGDTAFYALGSIDESSRGATRQA